MTFDYSKLNEKTIFDFIEFDVKNVQIYFTIQKC